ncbi:MAG: histidine kinase [Microbacterium sp.]
MEKRTIWRGLMLPPWRFVASRWPWIGLAYVAISAVLALPAALLVVLTLLLLPLCGIGYGAFERLRLRMLGVPRIASGHVRVPPGERHHWLGVRLGEPATWREAAALLAGIVFGALGLVALTAQAATLIVLVGVPAVAKDRGHAEVTLFADVRLMLGPADWWLPLLLVPIALLLGAYLNAALAAAQGAVNRWLLAPRDAEIDRRVEQLTRSRAAIVDAHERERRRIERDLHDGVQQELVAIAARLGLLELELDAGDADAARVALRQAQRQTESALATLRETVRGIHPAVLGDRGLAAAVEDLAGRGVMPILIRDLGFPRLPAAYEAAAYFVVAEAASNAAKHSAATAITVTLASDEGMVRVVVSDDGHGGADPARGTGLVGLIERADALGGALRIDSPTGGPTVLTLTLPAGPGGSAADGAMRERAGRAGVASHDVGPHANGAEATDAHPARR